MVERIRLLDGGKSLEIAYTMTPTDSLTLQLVGSATDYEDFTALGVIKVSDVSNLMHCVKMTCP